MDTNNLHIQACRNGQGFRGRKIVEVEVAVSRPARPACALDASQARCVCSAASAGIRLATSRKAIAAARLPRSNAVGKAPTLIATHRRAPRAPRCRARQASNSAPFLRWASRATAQLPCRDGTHGVLHSSGRSHYNTSYNFGVLIPSTFPSIARIIAFQPMLPTEPCRTDVFVETIAA